MWDLSAESWTEEQNDRASSFKGLLWLFCAEPVVERVRGPVWQPGGSQGALIRERVTVVGPRAPAEVGGRVECEESLGKVTRHSRQQHQPCSFSRVLNAPDLVFFSESTPRGYWSETTVFKHCYVATCLTFFWKSCKYWNVDKSCYIHNLFLEMLREVKGILGQHLLSNSGTKEPGAWGAAQS